MGSASESGNPRQQTPSDRHPEEGSSPPGVGPPVFPHPQWMVGIVLILGAMAILAGLYDPVWFLIGGPCIVVLALYAWVRFRTRGDRERQ